MTACLLHVGCDSNAANRSAQNLAGASVPAPTSTPTPTPPRKFLSPQNWPKLHDCDIVFIRSRSGNAADIAAIANPGGVTDEDDIFTHCGIVFSDGKDWKVFEGAGDPPVATLKEWQIREAKGGTLHNIYVRRWANADELTPSRNAKLLERAKTLHHTRYDNAFSWSDECAYCSELVWKAYDAAGLTGLPVQTVGYYLRKLPPNEATVITGRLNQHYACETCRDGKKVDLNDKAVSPEDIYQSDKLVSIVDDTP